MYQLSVEKSVIIKELLKICKYIWLSKIFKMNSFEKNKISRQKEKEYTFFEQIHDLDFDYTRQEEDDVLINSKPFCNGGIDYYVKLKKLILDKWGSTYKKRK